jgi:hypothetical protein
MRLSASRAAIVVLIGLAPGTASAGPPYRTDDPEPVELGHYQLYTLSTGTAVSNDKSGLLPGFEFDYGLIPNGQLTINAGVAFDSPVGGPTQFGYGDTEVSFKYRFIQEDKEGWRPQIAVFPLIELPTGDEDRGLGTGHVLAFLPIWVQKSFGSWTTYGGGGYWINQGGVGNKDYWFFGWLLQRKITDKLSVAGEIFHQTGNTIDVDTGSTGEMLHPMIGAGVESTGFNVGAIYDINEHNHFVFSVGRGFQNASDTNEFSWYVGYQISGP